MLPCHQIIPCHPTILSYFHLFCLVIFCVVACKFVNLLASELLSFSSSQLFSLCILALASLLVWSFILFVVLHTWGWREGRRRIEEARCQISGPFWESSQLSEVGLQVTYLLRVSIVNSYNYHITAERISGKYPTQVDHRVYAPANAARAHIERAVLSNPTSPNSN